jgi:hypothetical protein
MSLLRIKLHKKSVNKTVTLYLCGNKSNFKIINQWKPEHYQESIFLIRKC